jgi:hypothetical protein
VVANCCSVPGSTSEIASGRVRAERSQTAKRLGHARSLLVSLVRLGALACCNQSAALFLIVSHLHPPSFLFSSSPPCRAFKKCPLVLQALVVAFSLLFCSSGRHPTPVTPSDIHISAVHIFAELSSAPVFISAKYVTPLDNDSHLKKRKRF